MRKNCQSCKKQKLPFRSGPVTSSLDKVLQKRQICVQAYHGRSFIGNHCVKYISDIVTNELCQSVINTAAQCDPPFTIVEKAAHVQAKFQHLNQLFAEVHKVVGLYRPMSCDDIAAADRSIEAYMKFYRGKFADRSVIPKQHILESHASVWVQTWRFGTGFHGEQGGEQIYAIINRMKHRVWSIKNPAKKLKLIMTDHYLQVAPDLHEK